jgi:hypothetical protein
MKGRHLRDFNRLNGGTADVRLAVGRSEQRQKAGIGSTVSDEIVVAAQRRLLNMYKTALVSALVLATVSSGSVFAALAADREPLDAATLNTVRSRFSMLIELSNRYDLKALHEMFWQSPSALLVAKSAIPSEGN